MPSIQAIASIAQAAEVHIEWLSTGAGPMRSNNKDYPHSGGATVHLTKPGLQSRGVANDSAAQENAEQYSLIPFHEWHAASRTWAVQSETQAFKTEWLIKELRAQPEDLYMFHVAGEDMESTLRTGDTLLINKNDVCGDGIYLLCLDGAVLVKRLQHLAEGALLISSDNPNYQPFKIQHEDKTSVQILGRAVWLGHRL